MLPGKRKQATDEHNYDAWSVQTLPAPVSHLEWKLQTRGLELSFI